MSEETAPVADATDNAEPVATETVETPAEPDKSNGASWRETLPDDLKENASLSKFETIEGLAKSYTNLEKMLGSDKVPVPKDGDEEAIDRWYRASGWPEKPEEYQFEKPSNVPEGMEYDGELDQRLTGILHGSKLDKRQAAQVREQLIELVSEGAVENINSSKAMQEKAEADLKEGEESLRKEWGKAYDERARIAGRAMNELWGPDLMAAFESAGFGNHPVLVKKAYEMGVKTIGEKNLIGEGTPEQSPADLDAAISEFRQKHEAALMDKVHPDHEARTKELTNLYNKRYG